MRPLSCILRLHDWHYTYRLVVAAPPTAARVKRDCIRCGASQEHDITDSELEALLYPALELGERTT